MIYLLPTMIIPLLHFGVFCILKSVYTHRTMLNAGIVSIEQINATTWPYLSL